VPRAHCGHKPWNIRHVDRTARRRCASPQRKVTYASTSLPNAA
jgi:hypothetical protein